MTAPGIYLLMAASQSAPGAVESFLSAYSGLSGYWKFSEASGNIVDHVNGNNAALTATYTYRGTAGSDGGKYVLFSSGHAQSPDRADYSRNAHGLTMGVLFYPTANTLFLFRKYGGSGDREYYIEYRSTGELNVVATTSTGSAARYRNIPNGNVNLNAWNLLICEFPVSSTGFPTARLNALTPGSDIGTGTALMSGPAAFDFGSTISGALAHAFIYPGVDFDISGLEAAAVTDGWI